MPPIPLSERDCRALQQLAGDLEARGHRLTWQPTRSGYDCSLAAELDGRPLIGNTTVAHVREMAAAMLHAGGTR